MSCSSDGDIELIRFELPPLTEKHCNFVCHEPWLEPSIFKAASSVSKSTCMHLEEALLTVKVFVGVLVIKARCLPRFVQEVRLDQVVHRIVPLILQRAF